MRLWHLWCGCQQQQQLVELSQPGFKALAREWLWHKESRLSPLVLAERHHCLLRHQETGFHPLLVRLAAEGTCCSCAHVWQRQRGERGQAGVSGLCCVVQLRGGHDCHVPLCGNPSKHHEPEVPLMPGFIVLITICQEDLWVWWIQMRDLKYDLTNGLG